MFHDLDNNIAVLNAINPASISSTATGATLDTLGYEGVEFVVNIGAQASGDANNYYTLTVQEGNASDASDMATITDANRIVGNIPLLDAVNSVANTAYKFGVTYGTKRYMRVIATKTGTTTQIFGVTAVLHHPLHGGY